MDLTPLSGVELVALRRVAPRKAAQGWTIRHTPLRDVEVRALSEVVEFLSPLPTT